MTEYKKSDNASDSSVNYKALDKICMQFTVREEYAREVLEEYEDVEKASQVVQNYDAIKKSNVPDGMTLDYRI